MPWLFFGLFGVVSLIGYEVWKFKASGWTPVPSGPPAPLPTAPPGVVPTSPDPAGGVLVTLVPGNMGTLSVAGANGFPPPGVTVQVQPPSGTGPGIGWIGSFTSSNQAVATASLIHPGQSGQMSVPVLIMGPGTADVTVQWNDGQSAQTTKFTIAASA